MFSILICSYLASYFWDGLRVFGLNQFIHAFKVRHALSSTNQKGLCSTHNRYRIWINLFWDVFWNFKRKLFMNVVKKKLCKDRLLIIEGLYWNLYTLFFVIVLPVIFEWFDVIHDLWIKFVFISFLMSYIDLDELLCNLGWVNRPSFRVNWCIQYQIVKILLATLAYLLWCIFLINTFQSHLRHLNFSFQNLIFILWGLPVFEFVSFRFILFPEWSIYVVFINYVPSLKRRRNLLLIRQLGHRELPALFLLLILFLVLWRVLID